MPLCSVVIRACNEERHIGRLLEGITHQTVRDVEIVLVDSGSLDRTVEVAMRHPVRLVQIAPEEFTFGRSLNRGIEAATGELIVIASAHVYPLYETWLATLLAPFTDQQVALVYGKQRGDERTKYSERRVFEKWFPDGSVAHQDHPFCNNANAAIRRAAWAALPYDESLTGLEDLDWATRLLARGGRLSYAADAVVAHIHEETPARIRNRYHREALALKRIAAEETFHLWDFVRLFVGNVASDWWHAAHDRQLLRRIGEIVVFRLMQFWGTYRGFRQRAPVSGKLKQKFYYPTGMARRLPAAEPPGRRLEYREKGVGDPH